MSRKRLRTGAVSTVSPCLIALAVADTVVLNTGLLRYWIIYALDYDVREYSHAVCVLHKFTVYWSIRTAAWLLVLLSIGR